MILTTECLVVREKNYEPESLKHYQDRREFFWLLFKYFINFFKLNFS